MKPLLQQVREARMARRPLGSLALALAGHLIAHPVHAARYLACSRRDPLSCGLPWWSFGAIDFVDQFLSYRGGATAFEFGTGGSTIFLARRCGEVTCVENDAKWLQLVKDSARRRRLNNLTIEHEPTSVADCETFEATGYFQALVTAGKFDVIVVDGEDHYQQNPASDARPLCFFEAERHVQGGGIIVVDDSPRYPRIAAGHHAKKRLSFRGVGPSRLGMTTTDVYQY